MTPTCTDDYRDPCIPYIDHSGWFDVDLMEHDWNGIRESGAVLDALHAWNPELCDRIMGALADGIPIHEAFGILRRHQSKLRVVDELADRIQRDYDRRLVTEAHMLRLVAGNTWENAENTRRELEEIEAPWLARVRAQANEKRYGARPPTVVTSAPTVKSDEHDERMAGETLRDDFPDGKATRFEKPDGQTVWVDSHGVAKWIWMERFGLLMEQRTARTYDVSGDAPRDVTLDRIEQRMRDNGIRVAPGVLAA